MSFVTWALRRTASGFKTSVQNTNHSFQQLLQYAPGLAIVVWTVGSGGLTAMAAFIALAFARDGLGAAPIVASLVAITCVVYLMANVIIIMYAAYQQEQETMINTLRGRD